MVTIYALTCKTNGMRYVGCTAAKLSKRMREHRCLLNKRVHAEPLLQADWLAYGPNAFEMRTLEILPADASVADKRRVETHWMANFDRIGLLYNQNRASFSPTPEAIAKGQPLATQSVGNRWSAEANEKRRLAQLGKPKNHGHKISATKRAKQMMR